MDKVIHRVRERRRNTQKEDHHPIQTYAQRKRLRDELGEGECLEKDMFTSLDLVKKNLILPPPSNEPYH